MPRRSPLEAYAEQFADRPPLVGVIAAAVLAAAGWALPMFSSSTITAAWLQIGRALLWLTAFLVLVAVAAGIFTRMRDRMKFDATDDPATLTWREFERLIAEYYRRHGATVARRGGSGADGGVDLDIVASDGARLLVQCKQWKTRQVGVRPIRELWGVVADERADGAVFMTSGSYTADALAFAAGKRYELVDGPHLKAMIAAVKHAAANPVPVAVGPVSAPPRQPDTRQCPRCGAPMVMRTARRGAQAGGQFWGCSRYPDCRQTLPV